MPALIQGSAPSCEACILAGGLSERMGRNKARLRLGRRTLLGHTRAAAIASGLPVRVIRRDLVPRCGPIGGIYTALATTRSETVLFLACDMPFVTTKLIDLLGKKFRRNEKALFVKNEGSAGFPFILHRTVLPIVTKQIELQRHSLQSLAKILDARIIQVPRSFTEQLANINTPEVWRAVKAMRA